MPVNVVSIDPAPPAGVWLPTNVVAPGCLISGTPMEYDPEA